MKTRLKEILNTSINDVYVWPTKSMNSCYREIKESASNEGVSMNSVITLSTIVGSLYGTMLHNIGIVIPLCLLGSVYSLINPEFSTIADAHIKDIVTFACLPVITNGLSGAYELIRNRNIGLENKFD